MRTINRALCALSILVLCVSVHAQDTLRDKFLKDTTHTSPQPVRQPQGFFAPFKAGFALSTAVCVAGAAADIGTSLNGQELNPILRNRNGGLNVGRAILLKLPACFLPVLFERKHPKLAFWARMAAGISWGLVALRN
jgi:hypothetical protein